MGTDALVGGSMEQFDETWDDRAADGELECNSDPEELWRSLVADEEYPRYWSESVWSHAAEADAETGALLFADGASEIELARELRLSELWGRCEGGRLAMDEFFELSTLLTQVQGLPGSLCVDCEMLGRANVTTKLVPGCDDVVPSPSALPARSRADRRGSGPAVAESPTRDGPAGRMTT